MEDKIFLNIEDMNHLKSFYGKTTEEMMYLISNNEDTLKSMICSLWPSYYELRVFFEEVLGY